MPTNINGLTVIINIKYTCIPAQMQLLAIIVISKCFYNVYALKLTNFYHSTVISLTFNY